MPTPNSRPGKRRVPVNRNRILDAAIALADTEGMGAVTMRRLGGQLGVEGMALYNHVNNKEDLLDAMLDRVASEIELPDAGPNWREIARRRAISAHTVLMRHPWSVALWTASINLGPARMRYLDSALRNLREAGFPSDLLDRTFHAVENHIVGHALQALGFPLGRSDMQQMGQDYLRAFPADRYPDLAAHIRYHLDHPHSGNGFAFELDLILDSLERIRITT